MRSNLLHCLSLVVLVLIASCFSEGLKCYGCVSYKSWEDCEKTLKIYDCPPKADEVCVKEHHVEHDNNSEEGIKETFSKFCGPAKSCTNQHCIKDGKNCDPKCCHEDLCNTAVTGSPRAAVVIINLLLVNLAVMFIL
ncbi:hypothetical protein ACROYT_G039091 [Oculina patagonica]